MLERAEELKQRVRETPLSERLTDARRRIGKMCSEGRPPHMTIPVQYDDDDFYISTTLSDAQATIADLQGQLKAAKAPRMYDCGSCAIGKGFEQRVAQLEGEKQEYMQAATNEPLNEPLTYGALKAARFVAKRAFQELVKARADHAALLGLVRTACERWRAQTNAQEGISFRMAMKELEASLPAQPAACTRIGGCLKEQGFHCCCEDGTCD